MTKLERIPLKECIGPGTLSETSIALLDETEAELVRPAEGNGRASIMCAGHLIAEITFNSERGVFQSRMGAALCCSEPDFSAAVHATIRWLLEASVFHRERDRQIQEERARAQVEEYFQE